MAALRYSSLGFRDYHGKPVPVYPRSYWEFQAFTSGESALIMPGEGGLSRREIRTPSLWVFPPWFAHGWGGSSGESCEIAVFHFDGVDPAIERAVDQQRRLGYLQVELPPLAAARLEELARLGCDDLQHPGRLSALVSSLILAELSLMVLREPVHARELGASAQDLAQRKVRAALAWYESHLHEAPGFEQVAAAAHVSVPHLRRLFHQALGTAPSAALDRIRFQRVNALLGDHANTLQSIAERCGFGSASSLSRAYRRLHGRSPR